MVSLNISSATIDKLKHLANINSEAHEQILRLAFTILEGKEADQDIEALSASSNCSVDDINEVVSAAAELFWEFSKSVVKNERVVLNEVLAQVQLPASLIPTIVEVYVSNKLQLARLKQLFRSPLPRFKSLSWRLDIELAKRSMNGVMEPKFLFHLDLAEKHFVPPSRDRPSGSQGEPSVGPEKVVSCNIEADYANMKRLQSRLQSAVDALESVHCQRIMRYIA